MSRTVAVVVAAGESRRMGEVGDKQFALLAGRPAVAHALRAFEESAEIEGIVLVCAPDRLDDCRRLVRDERLTKVSDIVAGGEERQDSVANGLACVDEDAIVAVHDGARPLVTSELIADLTRALPGWDGVVPALGVTDTVKQVDAGGAVIATLDRVSIRLAQTPQLFAARRLRTAVEAAQADGIVATDDAALVERIGGRVRIMQGLGDNIKITYPADLERAEVIVASRSRR